MKNLTVHERINFKSHFAPIRDGGTDIYNFPRIKRPDHYGHDAEKDSYHKSFNIPYWYELQGGYFTPLDAFKNKF